MPVDSDKGQPLREGFRPSRLYWPLVGLGEV